VRRAGGQIRINAQLIDAKTGGHLWAERYDGKLDNIFDLQDKITRKIVTALSVKLTPAEVMQRTQKYTDNVQAYDALLQGRNLDGFDSLEEFNLKVKYFEKALELDPTYGHAHAALAELYEALARKERRKHSEILPGNAQLLANQHIKEAMKKPTPLAHRIRANLYARRGDWDNAVAEAGLAIDLNPNDSDGYLSMGDLLVKIGKPAEAQVYLNEAIRINPKGDYTWHLASIKFHLERFDEAVGILLSAIENNPEEEWHYFLLAASYGHLGRETEGKEAIRVFNDKRLHRGRGHGAYTTRKLDLWDFKDISTRERLREGLHKAGMS
jgi:tetratricopeptide (TPR) repeat protein